jgi:hypothetical protein
VSAFILQARFLPTRRRRRCGSCSAAQQDTLDGLRLFLFRCIDSLSLSFCKAAKPQARAGALVGDPVRCLTSFRFFCRVFHSLASVQANLADILLFTTRRWSLEHMCSQPKLQMLSAVCLALLMATGMKSLATNLDRMVTFRPT